MLRYKTKTRPGLVALYDIRTGNGAGPFLQPRSPHGAISNKLTFDLLTLKVVSESRVTYVGYLCANFSLPRPLCSRVRPDVRDRQASDGQTADNSIA